MTWKIKFCQIIFDSIYLNVWFARIDYGVPRVKGEEKIKVWNSGEKR